MAVAGFLLVALGVGGLVAHRFVDLDPRQVDNITGASWAAVVVGALLVLTRAARGAFGPGVFPLAAGATALAAQPATHWLDVAAIGGWRHMDDHSAVASLLLVTVVSLVTDIFVDFGRWDGAVNVLTAVAAAGFVVGSVIHITSLVDLLDGPERGRTIAAYEPGRAHPIVQYGLLWGLRVAAAAPCTDCSRVRSGSPLSHDQVLVPAPRAIDRSWTLVAAQVSGAQHRCVRRAEAACGQLRISREVHPRHGLRDLPRSLIPTKADTRGCHPHPPREPSLRQKLVHGGRQLRAGAPVAEQPPGDPDRFVVVAEPVQFDHRFRYGTCVSPSRPARTPRRRPRWAARRPLWTVW